MPLVIPGLMGQSSTSNSNSNQQSEWMNKLMGKKITESTSGDNTCFAKQDLPKDHRVIEHGDMITQDHKADRMNVHLGEDGTVRDVKFG